jgi:general secretion pathway protein K
MTTQPHTPRRPLWRHRRSERGIALLMVLITMAVLTAVVAEFVYQTRIEVQMAANVRDRVKAYYLARSAIDMARLVVYFQGRIDQQMGSLAQLSGLGTSGASTGAVGGTMGGMQGSFAVKLYQIFPIASDLAKALTSGEIGEMFGMQGLDLGNKHGFSEFDGSFHATIEDEYAKINVNALNSIPTYAGPTAAQIYALIGNPKYAPMFENPDADGQYNTPASIIDAMHDWIDPDTTMDKFEPEAVVRAPFSQTIDTLFAPGVSSEDSRYDMLKDPYKNKNAPFVTVDELYFIRGMGDDFMREFGDKFTVYSDPNLLVNLSSVNDPVTMLSLICVQPENALMCSEQSLPTLLGNLAMFFEFRNQMQAATFMVPDKQLTATILQSMGTVLPKAFLDRTASTSDTFSVQAQGEVGETTVTIKAVVKNTGAGQETLYWRVM